MRLYLLVELNFTVEVLLGDRGKALDLLCVVYLHLGDRRVQNGLTPRRDFLVWLRRGSSGEQARAPSICEGCVKRATCLWPFIRL